MHKRDTRRRLTAMLTAAVMAAAALGASPAFPAMTVSADDITDIQQKQQEVQQKLDETNKNLAAMEGKVDEQEAYNQQLYNQLKLSQQKVDLMGEQILAMSDSIAQKQAEVEQKQEEITKKEEEISLAEQDIDSTFDQFKVRMRSLYMAGELTSLQMLLSADSFADFYLNAELMKAVSRSDEQLIGELRDQKAGLEDQKTALEQTKQLLEEDILDIEKQKEVLLEQQGEIRNAQTDLEQSYAENKDILDQYESQAESARGDRDKLREEYEQVEQEMQRWFQEQERIRKEKEEEQRRLEEERRRKEEEERKRREEEAAANGEYLPEESEEPDDGDVYVPDGEAHTSFAWPLRGYSTIWCSYGQQDGYFHYGMDISGGGINGADIYASESGTVMIATSHYSYGNYVVIDHGGGYATLYAHASALLVSAGDTVGKGQVIAKVGSTGNSTGPHLHFEVRINGQTQNPLGFVSP